MMIAHSAPLLSQTLSAVDLRDPEISALIAKKLREFNDLDMPGPKNVSLWQRLRHAVFDDTFFIVVRMRKCDWLLIRS
jgi:hypothetical protein